MHSTAETVSSQDFPPIAQLQARSHNTWQGVQGVQGVQGMRDGRADVEIKELTEAHAGAMMRWYMLTDLECQAKNQGRDSQRE